jgi:hypothetical protein
MRRVHKLAGFACLSLVAGLLAGCLVQPVRENLRLDFKAGGGVLVTSEIHIADPDGFKEQERAERRIENARRDAADEQDDWSRRLSRLAPPWDERTVERREGEIVRVTRRTLLDDVRQLEELFEETDVDCELEHGDEWIELSFLPGVSRRATARQRELYEPIEEEWIRYASRYLAALSALYEYLQREPSRAEICLAPLLEGMVRAEDVEDLPEPDEREMPLVLEAKEAADQLQSVFAVPEDSGYTIDELSSLVHDPFPAPIDVSVPGEILLVEGFSEDAGILKVRGPSLWNAWRSIGDDHLVPDPVRVRWKRERSQGEEKLSLSEFASRPRFFRALDERELEALIAERLEPPSIFRVRWVHPDKDGSTTRADP